MKQIDLDDLPPRIAQLVIGLSEGQELAFVQHGAVVARLEVRSSPPPPAKDEFSELPEEERMAEVLDQFNAMIHDEF